MQTQQHQDLGWVDNIGIEIKEQVVELAPELIELSHTIYNNPELKFEEFQAASALEKLLAKKGFDIKSGICGMKTAFRAERSFGKGGPTIGIFCEYDALADIGHACGHNIIATSGAGAAIAALQWLEKQPVVNGRIIVLGSPGEEGGGGKVHLINGGELKDIDAMVMVHPFGYDVIEMPNLSRIALDVEFLGKSSHASSAPEQGLNALDAATLMLVAIGLLRQQLRPDSRVHAVVVDGGQAVNIIPERSRVKILIRSPDDDYLQKRLYRAICDCAQGSAIATGTTVQISEAAPLYQSIKSNLILSQIAVKAFGVIGRKMNWSPTSPSGDIKIANANAGSTDMGNVTRVLPAIHPYICLEEGLDLHTRQFQKAAGSQSGDKAAIDAASALGTIICSLIKDPELANKAKQEFDNNKN